MIENSASTSFSVLTIRLRHERHVVHTRQRAREVAALLGFDHQDQIRLATAASELARNAFRYADSGIVEFQIRDTLPQFLVISVTDSGPGIPNLADILDGKYVSRTGLGKGIIGTRRLMDRFEISSSPIGTHVEAGKALPHLAPLIDADKARKIALDLASSNAADPFDEVERQNQELLKTLAELREKQDQLAELNRELEDTNRGVVALYAELDRNADDLRRVSNLKTSFLSNLSHEFRTPLNSITSLCHLLLGRSDGELTLEQEKQVGFIQKSSGELTDLVDDLLDLAKVEAGKIDVRPKHFEVQDVFGALRGMLRPLLVGTSLDLIFEASSELPPLFTDEGKLSQILRNLISNALKFTRRGFVRVSATLAEDGFLEFRVADSGIGIAPEDRERIFEEFVQVDSEIQLRVKGTGLGLPLSKRLAELLGGTISVDSEVDIGSTFLVRLPAPPVKAPPVASEETKGVHSDGPAILFIEDNFETSFVHQTALKSSDYQLTFALNIPEARAVMRTCKPALVALDRFLDGTDSLSFIDELRRGGYAGPVLVISVVDDEASALAAHANAFLVKPVPGFRLEQTIRRLLGRPKGKTILLADDDEVSRYVLSEALTKFGLTVIEAQNGREALKIAEREALDGVFLDVLMPELNGFEVIRGIRSDTSKSALPVIIHSSKELSTQEIDYIRNSGAIAFSKRDFSGDDGRKRLSEVLQAAGIIA